ncbi:flagellar motor switch phosphatase FliY [Shouchella shacheensis]|uniref:flagellar motor switch phosphatase FliY n=1 Tax=Shouchella shacheensis TaxID=1649580 RepID=UPI0007402DE4|nr:flagellar motor switch phosphatase FliY [Shouchella shacheensis]
MSDDKLSQDEINELLKGMQNQESNEEETKEASTIHAYLTEMEKDTVGEIGNISIGSSVTALSTLLNQKVEITAPEVSIVGKDSLKDTFPHPHVVIHVRYTEGFEGTNLFVITTEDAAIIADLMLGGDGQNPSSELSDMYISAVQEAMNQMMGSASTSMSTLFNRRVDISPPEVDVVNFQNQGAETYIPEGDLLINISFRLQVGSLINSRIMQLVSVPFGKNFSKALLEGAAPSGEASAQQKGEEEELQSMPLRELSEDRHTEEKGESFGEREGQHVGARLAKPDPVVQKAVFSNFESSNFPEAEMHNLNMLLDIPLEVKVELGRTRKTIRDILAIAQGSIIELDKLAGEPVDVLINDKLIAKGEVVVIDENFGVRITDIVSQKERITQLK